MKLFEYEAKTILSTYGIPTPRGGVTADPIEGANIAARLKPPYVVKAQVLVAGRGKAGGIVFAEDTSHVKTAAEKLLQTSIKGNPVKRVLVEERVPIARELYFGVTVGRAERRYILISSTAGGMDVEEVAAMAPESVVKTLIDPQNGFTAIEANSIALRMGYTGSQLANLAGILMTLYRVGIDFDAELIEMNPLAETTDGKFIAVDARLIVDDNALFRHRELEKLGFSEERENTPIEVEAAKLGLAYVKLNGTIGVIGNGAGLVMATIDTIQNYGGTPADFLDLGGGAPIERIAEALRIVTSDPDVKTVFVNILGGITHCDDVARAIIETTNSTAAPKPLVFRLVGTNETEGRRMLRQSGIEVLDSMEEAARKVVQLVKEEK